MRECGGMRWSMEEGVCGSGYAGVAGMGGWVVWAALSCRGAGAVCCTHALPGAAPGLGVCGAPVCEFGLVEGSLFLSNA